MTKHRAIFELLIADILWGFAFVAVPLAHRSWDSSQITFLRFATPSVLGLLIGLAFPKWRVAKRELQLGALPGLLFALTIYFQTVGLEFTTPSKSSFITVLYVLFVPLLEVILHGKKLPLLFWAFLSGALVGMGLLFDLEWSHWNWGDSLTIVCAVFATWHIHQVGNSGSRFRNPIYFNLAQCSWAAIFLLPLAFFSEGPWLPTTWDTTATFGLFMIIFGATMVAFTIQIRVQAHLDLSTSATLFLLESPLAMFFSWMILKESISLNQTLGAILMLFCCYRAVQISIARSELQMT